MESRYFSNEIVRQSSNILSSNILKLDLLKDRIHFSIVNPLGFENQFEKVLELYLGMNRYCQLVVLGAQSRVLLRDDSQLVAAAGNVTPKITSLSSVLLYKFLKRTLVGGIIS